MRGGLFERKGNLEKWRVSGFYKTEGGAVLLFPIHEIIKRCISTLASQMEYLTSLMKLALRSLSISSLTTLCRSSPIFLSLWDTGLALGKMANFW